MSNRIRIKKNTRKPSSEKSNSSTDKSITCESDDEDDNNDSEIVVSKDKYLCGKCFLKL